MTTKQLNGIVNMTMTEAQQYILTNNNVRKVFYGKNTVIVYVKTGYDLIIELI